MLKDFKDIHKGKDAFLVACGPSLNDIPVCLLNGEIVYGVSLAYKYDGLNIDYHFIGDMNIYGQKKDEVLQAKNIEHFFTSNGIYEHYETPENTHFWNGRFHPHFSTNAADGVHGGGTSTFVAMQFAYYMGIQKLYVVGLDHYDTLDEQLEQVRETGFKKNKHNLVVTTGEDVNHFTKDFYPKGTAWFVPQVERMANSYRMAREAFEKDGREIWNCSTHTVLDEYYLPRKDFWSLY
jgi:hypothetical protein